MEDIYKQWRTYENDNIILRPVIMEDAEALLKVYSDKKAQKLFNCDNYDSPCYFETLKQMQSEIEFYLKSYEHKQFVRWTIVEKKGNKIIGTIENFYRQADDYFGNKCLLRLDILSTYERKDILKSILQLVIENASNDFKANAIASKATPIVEAKKRIAALYEMGFVKSDEILVGYKGEQYQDYYVFSY